MPTVEELENLNALLERLVPLKSKTRGELIEADDWNTLVNALIDVGRAALAEREDASVLDHEHPDQVSVGWLDQQLKLLITGGGIRDPAVESDFFQLRRDITTLGGRIDRADDALAEVRLRVSDVSTQAVLHESDVSRLDRKVLGAADTRGDIADLRRTLQTIESEVGRAVEVGGRLEVNGEPIDVPGLVARVSEVEKLRDRFTTASGELLDAAELERRVGELQGSLVTRQTLTQSLGDLREDILNTTGGGGRPFDPDIFLGEVRLAARDTAAEQVDVLGTDLRSTMDAQFAQIEPTVNGAVARATADLGAGIRESVRGDVEQLISRNNESIRAELESSFQSRVDAVNDTLTRQLQDVNNRVSERVDEQLRAQVPEMLRGVSERLNSVETRIADMGGRFDVIEGTVVADRTRAETAIRGEAAARADLRSELTTRADALDSGLDVRVATAVDAARDVLRTEQSTAVEAAKRDLATALSDVARQQASTEVQVLATSVRTEVQSAIRQEIEASLAGVQTEIATQVEAMQRQIGGLVAAEVTRVSADIPTLVQAQFDSFRPEIDRIVDSRIRIQPGPIIVTRPDGPIT